MNIIVPPAQHIFVCLLTGKIIKSDYLRTKNRKYFNHLFHLSVMPVPAIKALLPFQPSCAHALRCCRVPHNIRGKDKRISIYGENPVAGTSK